ncbi:MAG: hypothetical protein NXH78_12530 [Hyphomonadaceae bacterium]|nr:hypothetical protein [Hyphomonadaceae bacterium]
MMALVERPDPRKKLILAAGLDFLIVALGVAMFVVSGSPLWILMAVAFGAVVSVPLILAAMREIRERDNASG